MEEGDPISAETGQILQSESENEELGEVLGAKPMRGKLSVAARTRGSTVEKRLV